MEKRPAVKFALALSAGIIVAYIFDLKADFLTSLLLAIFALVIFSIFIKSKVIKFILIYISIILAGSAKYISDAKLVPRNDISKFFTPGDTVKLIGKLTSLVQVKPRSASFVVSAIAVKKLKNKPLNTAGDVYCLIRKGKSPYDSIQALNYGDIVEIPGVLKAPSKDGFGRYLRTVGIRAVLYGYTFRSVKKIQSAKLNFIETVKLIAFKVRIFLLETIEKYISGDESAFLKGLIAGYRGEIPKTVKRAFVDTGTYHILAVSGLHVGIITLVLLAITSFLRIGLRLRVAFVILFLFLYSLVVGLPPSVVRASIMASLILIGWAVEREIDIYNIIAVAFIIMLLYDSRQIFHPGFQLSFSAVISIVYFHPKLMTVLRKIFPVLFTKKISLFVFNLLSASTGAQILTLPFVIFYFKKISLVSLIANLFVVPLVGLAIPSGFAMIISSLIYAPIAKIYAASTWFILHMILIIENQLSTLPFASVKVKSWFAFVIGFVYMALFVIFSLRKVFKR